MSAWNHPMCEVCWNTERGAAIPVRCDGKPDVCCYCGQGHRSGIYVRANPDSLRCKGKHDGDEAEA